MKTLITGGSGFIGKKLLERIPNSKSFDINGDAKNTIYGDICLYQNILEASHNMDGILHLAAISRVSDCQKDVSQCVKINILGTLNVIEAVKNNNLKWIALVTTGEVVWIENNEVKSFKRIDNLYGITKLTNELFLDVYNTKSNFNSVIFRISSVVFGAITDNENKVFPLFVKKAINNENIVINNMTLKWDFIHINDVVSIISDTLESISEKKPDKILEINISSGVKLNLLELARLLHYLSQSSSIIEYDNNRTENVTISEYNEIISVNKINDEFISSIKSTIKEYKENVR